MQHLRAFKYRIHPNDSQRSQLAKFFGAKRWLFNHYLAIQKERFLNKEKYLSNFDINKLITHLKKEETTSWLSSIDAMTDMGEIPMALQKMTSKIERSSTDVLVGHGSGQAVRSIVV